MAFYVLICSTALTYISQEKMQIRVHTFMYLVWFNSILTLKKKTSYSKKIVFGYRHVSMVYVDVRFLLNTRLQYVERFLKGLLKAPIPLCIWLDRRGKRGKKEKSYL